LKREVGTLRFAHPTMLPPEGGEEEEKGGYARAYLPRLKKRSFWSSLAVSRFDLMPPTTSIIFFAAGRAAIASNQRLRFGLFSHFTPMLSWLRVHGNVAMSAIVYSSPPR